MKPKRDFELEMFFPQWEFKARYNLGGSDLESLTVSELLSMASPEDRAAWDDLYLGYTETWGRPALREVIAGTYDEIQSDHVLCFAGAEEGIFCAMHAVLEPGDHALVVTPCYQSAESVPLSIGEVTGLPLDPEDGWSLDPDRVRTLVRSNTRLIYINFPHNPTGKVLERDRFDALVDICRERGIYLFSDEVYRLLERDPERRLPQAADVYEKALSLNVMSKAYGLAGLRVGWIAGRDLKILSKMERLKHYLTICNSAPSEHLALVALKNRDKILKRNRKIVDRNLNLLHPFFERHTDRFEWSTPDGGCIGFPRYLGQEGVAAFSERLIREKGVILVPASVYRSDLGPSPTDRFRIGYGRIYFERGLNLVEEFLSGR